MKKTYPASQGKPATRKTITQQQAQVKPKQNINKPTNVHIVSDIVKIVQSTIYIIFQEEIDHQIAKCLDTLDRQGLKFLRQTLKNSDIFNEESKKIINDINKQKNQVNTNTKLQGKNKNVDLIQQQIIVEHDKSPQKRKQLTQQKSKFNKNFNQPLKQQKPIPIKLQKFQAKIHQPLKPFNVKPASRQGMRVQQKQQSKISHNQSQIQKKSSKIQIKQKPQKKQQQIQIKKSVSQEQKIKQVQVKKDMDMNILINKISHLPQQKLKKLMSVIDHLENSQKIQLDSLKTTKPYLFKEDPPSVPNQSNMKVSQNKNRNKQKATSLHDSILKNKNQSGQIKQSQVKPKYENKQKQVIDPTNQIDEQIPNFEQQKQANQPKFMDIPDKLLHVQTKQATKLQSNYQSQPSEINKTNAQQLIKKNSFLKNLPITNIKKPLDIQITQSHQVETFEMSQSKMVRVGKKKLGTNKVKLVLINNRGHSSIIGLTCIQFYNINGKIIPITIQNIKSASNPKLLKLFNGIYKTTDQQQMFTTTFKRDYQIQLDIQQKIGGMKIWNYNKSQIQSNKETDWIQFYINDKLVWEGLILKGSYNDINDYCTEANVQDNFFEKLKEKQENYKSKRIQQQHESPSSQECISSPIKSKNVYLGKQKQKQKQTKVDWLQRTLMQQQIKQLAEEDKKIQNAQINPPKRLSKDTVARFSQIYEDETNKYQQKNNNIIKPSQVITFRKQQNLTVNKQVKNDYSKQKQNQAKGVNINIQKVNAPSDRLNKAASKKIQEQSDIFSAFGQNVIRQKATLNQINAKANDILQKTQKFKQNFLKNTGNQFGYASLINKQQPQPQPKRQQKEKYKVEPQIKKAYKQQSLDDFMNDSMFQSPKKNQQRTKNTRQAIQNQPKIERKYEENPKQYITNNNHSKPESKVDIDDFLNQLNDLVGTKQNRYRFGNQKQKQIIIPQIPKGNKMEILLLSNWGDSQIIGLCRIQFFDNQGQKVYPIQAKSNIQGLSVVSLFSQSNQFINDHTNQWKCQKKQNIKIQLSFNRKIQFSFIRIWNFIGDRVHSMCGVKQMQIILDGSIIFMGDIRKNGGHSRQQILKSCEPILFTNNSIIQKKIMQNDWFSQQIQGWRQQKVLFKKTMQNFMRPQTNGLDNKNDIKITQNKQPIKLPKRNCFQYDPPTMPTGYYLKITLHTTWGDRDFIGLNGLIIYDQKCNQITGIKKVSQFPAPLITLAGYQKDKRVLNNLFNGKNITSNDENIWLAPYLSDIDKMQKKSQNAILIQFDKPYTISAVNIYNYVKTPQRGVRQIQLHIDQYLVYRGYLKQANVETGQIMTTINFTKQNAILQKIGYFGYHQDNLTQDVNYYNQGKLQKAVY